MMLITGLTVVFLSVGRRSGDDVDGGRDVDLGDGTGDGADDDHRNYCRDDDEWC